MEATPDQKRKFTDYFHGQQDGTGPAPSGPTRPGARLTDHIKARLSGAPTSDPLTAGDAVDQQANDAGTSAEDEARAKLDQIDPAIIAAIDDDTDPLHAVAVRLLTAFVALEKIRLQKAGPA